MELNEVKAKGEQLQICGLIYNLPCTRTAIAEGKVTVLSLESRQFRSLLTEIDEVKFLPHLEKINRIKIIHEFKLLQKQKLYLASNTK